MSENMDLLKNRAGKTNLALASMLKAAPQAATDANIQVPIDNLDEYHDEFGGSNNELFGIEEDVVENLVQTIKRDGFNGVVQVVKSNTPGRYMIVEGHQRVEALRRLGKTTVPCHVLSGSPEQIRNFWRSSNTAKRNLSSYRYALLVKSYDEDYARLKKAGDKEATMGGRDKFVSERLFGNTTGTSQVKRYRTILTFGDDLAKRCDINGFPVTILVSSCKGWSKDDLDLLETGFKDWDKKHPGEVISADSMRRIISKVKSKGPEYGDVDPAELVIKHTGKNSKEADRFAEKQLRDFKDHFERVGGEAPEISGIIDEPLGKAVDDLYRLVSGKFRTGNRVLINQSIYGLERVIDKLKKEKY